MKSALMAAVIGALQERATADATFAEKAKARLGPLVKRVNMLGAAKLLGRLALLSQGADVPPEMTALADARLLKTAPGADEGEEAEAPDRLHSIGELRNEFVQTGLRRAELIALDWADLELEGARPSLLVRCGKGGKPRRQPLAPSLADELAALRAERNAAADAPVFCGLEGKRLQPTILVGIIRRAAERAAIEKRVTAHTLRHTAATWLRRQTGEARLVAAYLGHADLSTVSRYAHVVEDELHEAAAALAAHTAVPNAA